MKTGYEKNSITLVGGIAMGTGVMIGAGIFALTGQMAELAGTWFPLSFLAGAVVTGFSAYSYVKVSQAYPSAGGIAMILQKAYGSGALTAGAALLMALSMVINESLVARTFGTYALRPFGLQANGVLVGALSVALIVFVYFVNARGTRSVGTFSVVMALIKIGGIVLFGVAALWVAGIDWQTSGGTPSAIPLGGFIASVALAVLAFKGFTTITNSGAEMVDPHRNVGRTIVISIVLCVLVYLLVAFAVRQSLPLSEIVRAKDYALAAAAEPSLGTYGFYLTVVLAMVATASGLLASVFAVSRMLAMLTDMKLIPHSHFGMSGGIQEHMLVYTVVIAGALAVFFDLGRIASLGAFFYLVMDIVIHWGVLRHLRADVRAHPGILISAITLDAVILAVFAGLKLVSDPLIVAVAVGAMAATFVYERAYLGHWTGGRSSTHAQHREQST